MKLVRQDYSFIIKTKLFEFVKKITIVMISHSTYTMNLKPVPMPDSTFGVSFENFIKGAFGDLALYIGIINR